MPFPNPGDDALSELAKLANRVLMQIDIMHHRGVSQKATALRLAKDIREMLQEFADRVVEHLDVCVAVTEIERTPIERAPTPTPRKPRRRHTERIAKRRKK